jgi:hypothetical protein
MLLKSKKLSKNIENSVLLLKIIIISLAAIYLIGNFNPFYEGTDSFLYGNIAINFSNGVFSISNELLEETGKSQFVGTNWLKTVHGDAVPRAGVGFAAIASIFYSIFGYYALFYLGPITAVLLLVVSERISTKLFGKYCGLLTLMFVATNHLIFRNSLNLQTESMFALLFLVGTYFFITFFKTKKNNRLLLASCFFVFASFIKINGLAFLPVEIGIILLIFLIKYVSSRFKNNKIYNSSKLFSITPKKGIKITSYILLPWIVFLVFWFSYYDYYFEETTINYRAITATANELAYDSEIHRDAKLSSLYSFEEKTFENIKAFSKYLLPYQIPAVYNNEKYTYDEILGNNWIGILSISGVIISLIWSRYTKNKQIEFLVFSSLIGMTVWFFSSVTTWERALSGVPGRYMIGAFVLFVMMLSYLIIEFLKMNSDNKKISFQILLKSGKIFLILGLFVFFTIAFYNANPIQAALDDKEFFKDPEKFTEKYPLDMEGLTKNSIIIAHDQEAVIEYGMIPFFILDNGKLTNNSVNLLKQIISKDNEIFIFKIPTTNDEKKTLQKLVNEYGFVLKDYSETFCKVSLNQNNEKPDDICIK